MRGKCSWQINYRRMDKVHGVDVDHEGDQYRKANAVDDVLVFGGDAAARDEFNQHEENAAAIQRGERKQIEDADADGQQPDQFECEIRGRLRCGWRGRPAGGRGRRLWARAALHIAADGLAKKIVDALEAHEASLIGTDLAFDDLGGQGDQQLRLGVNSQCAIPERLQRRPGTDEGWPHGYPQRALSLWTRTQRRGGDGHSLIPTEEDNRYRLIEIGVDDIAEGGGIGNGLTVHADYNVVGLQAGLRGRGI